MHLEWSRELKFAPTPVCAYHYIMGVLRKRLIASYGIYVRWQMEYYLKRNLSIDKLIVMKFL